MKKAPRKCEKNSATCYRNPIRPKDEKSNVLVPTHADKYNPLRPILPFHTSTSNTKHKHNNTSSNNFIFKTKHKHNTKKHSNNSMKDMKLVWSPERATNSYIDTVQAVTTINNLPRESGAAELVSSMAAGWNAQLIVETWSYGGVIPTSVGLSIASGHTGGRHVCIVPDERSRSEYAKSMAEAGMSPEVLVGEAEEVMDGLVGIDFLVVDSRRKDFTRVLRLAKLSSNGAVLICKNANFISKMDSGYIWRSVVARGSRRLVRSVFLPVGKGIHMAHFSAAGGGENSVAAMKHKGRGVHKWIKHVDQRSGDVHFIRK